MASATAISSSKKANDRALGTLEFSVLRDSEPMTETKSLEEASEPYELMLESTVYVHVVIELEWPRR